MKAVVFFVLVAATAVLAEEFVLETPLQAGRRRVPKIVGGREATPHSIPFQVALVMKSSYFCGGSLITKRYVLTAGHCGAPDTNPRVILGAHKVQEKEPEQVVMTGKKVTVHRSYSPSTLRNDIAVIELPQDAPIGKNIQTVKLINQNAGLLIGAQAQASGWGLAYDGAQGISPVLRVVDLNVISNSDCSKKFGLQIWESVICIDGSQKKSTCSGDSGGPLVTKNGGELALIGVTSFGHKAGCEKGYPAGFSRVTSFYDWIKTNTDYKF